jgi:hypothetical protein
MLNEGDIGTLFELANGVDEAVLGNSSVGVDDQNDRAAVCQRDVSNSVLHIDSGTHIRMLPSAQASPSVSETP